MPLDEFEDEDDMLTSWAGWIKRLPISLPRPLGSHPKRSSCWKGDMKLYKTIHFNWIIVYEEPTSQHLGGPSHYLRSRRTHWYVSERLYRQLARDISPVIVFWALSELPLVILLVQPTDECTRECLLRCGSVMVCDGGRNWWYHGWWRNTNNTFRLHQ